MSNTNLITTCTFQGHQYLIKMNVINGFLELVITDKQSGEEWECNYDASYIETLTRKTGNYKQFEIFITMLKAGLLKTTDSIALDLLTYEDLESLRFRRVRSHHTTRLKTNNSNRRYLIVTYSVEFDKINYPLPLEYCGPPDPTVLQGTVRKLETELAKIKQELQQQSRSRVKPDEVHFLEKRIDELTMENLQLREELKQLSQILSSASRKPKSEVQTLQKAIIQLERNVISERNSHHRLVDKLQKDKEVLSSKVDKLKNSEKLLKEKLQQAVYNKTRINKNNLIGNNLIGDTVLDANRPNHNVRGVFQRTKSPFTRRTKQRYFSERSERSRSASPRTIGDEACHTSTENTRAYIKTKSRSRSNSRGSSTRQSEKDNYASLPLIDLNSPGRSRKTSPRSRSASPYNQVEREFQIPIERLRKNRSSSVASKDSSTTVKMLENRIRKLMHD